jgi:alpha-ketoglutarate-dependent taurine dioxygenase
MEDSKILAPEFVSAMEREKITPWRSFVNHNDFKIERERIGDIEIEDTLRLVQKYGLCLLRLYGQSPDENTLRVYFESFGQVMNVQNHSPGEVKNIRPSPDIAPNTGDSAGDLGFHPDGTQTPDQPALLAFQYVVTADLGGNSRFVDLARILIDLPDSTRERLFATLSQPDTAVFEKNGMRLISPIFHLPDGESLACRIRIDDVITVKEECREDFQLLKNILVEGGYGIRFKPRPGDIVVFDNWRLLHARDTVMGNSQRHHRRVWMEALLPHYQADFKLGIRPISPKSKALISERNNSTD